MRVTYVVNTLVEGGTERSLADLLPGLQDAGIEVNIVTLRAGGDAGVEPVLRALGFDITTIGPTGPFATVRSLRRIIRARRPDIVHTMLFDANLFGRVAALGSGARTIVSLVNTTYSPERLADPRLRRWKVRAVQTLDRMLARFATHRFHAVSRAVKADAISGLGVPADKVTVIERGRRAETLLPRTDDRRAAARQALGLPQDAEVLVTVGRQEYQKGQRYLLEAMRTLRDRPALVLLVAGREGNETVELQRVLSTMPDVAERILLLGYRPDVPQVLMAGDLFVFPSLFEGMPGAVIEAMACALPIVASDIEPVREVVEAGVNAELVPLRDADALADAIRALLDDPSRRRGMGDRSRQIFEERFTIQRSVDGFLQLYREVATY